MAKKKHKWKYRINIKKKILVLVILGVSLFVGLGYAIVEANLGIGGTLSVSKYEKTLYGALKKEVNLGYAAKYSGDHQDSMDSTKSTEDIYHFYAETNQKGTDILDKNNVVFADKCWQMIRTTDTGGVKLLYNGDPETTIVDGVTQYNCGDTRNLYHEGGILSTYNLSGSKKYGKNYTATTSGTTTTFTLVDDPDDPDDTYTVSINSSNAAAEIAYIAENYPYTCGNTTGTKTNIGFYKVVSQSNGTTANVYNSTQRDNIGKSAYNTNSTVPTYFGYKYGDVYARMLDLVGTTTQSFISSTSILFSTSFSSTHKYSKVLNLTGTSSVYELDNPILGSDIPEDTYAGYYTYRNASTVSGTSPYYIVAASGTGTNYYYVQLSATKNLVDLSIQVGTNLVDNLDGTYTVKNGTNQSTEVTPLDWYNNYANYVGKYTCGDSSDTCQTPRYIISSAVTGYSYLNPIEQITIAKSRNGLELSNYITVSRLDWYSDYETYGDYKYTCGDTSTTCTEANLRYVSGYTSAGYTYSPNHYFGKSVKYESNVYKLQDIEGLEAATNLTTLSTHHYVCKDLGTKECSQVAYVYDYAGTGNMVHIVINDPEIESVQDVLNAMLKKNTTDSTIKTNIDKWYEDNLLNTVYESKLDDTIFCNNRSIDSLGGWNDNGGNTTAGLSFSGVNSLNCLNEEDRFSVSNNKAQLTYKIGLISSPEMSLLNQNGARINSYVYWTLSPAYSTSYWSWIRTISDGGSGSSQYSSVTYGVRPAISLIKDAKYSRGTGKMTDPYVVDMSE